MVAGHRMLLATLLAQPYPKPTVLNVHIVDRHTERGADAGERVNHEANQSAVPQASDRRYIDAVEERARFRRLERRRFPGSHNMSWPTHRMRGVDRYHLAVDKPIEQVAQRGQPLLDGRRGQFARSRLNPSCNMDRLDAGDRRDASVAAPGQEFRRGAVVGSPRVRVADVGREEFEEAHRGTLASPGDKRWQGRRTDRREVVP